VAGELWIGGAGIATGYRSDAQITARKFVNHDGERWYRTGDVGRYWPGGSLEFLGRLDDQVKVGGHRIELGEIESALHDCDEVGQAVVVALGDKSKTLAACLIPRDARTIDPADIRRALADRLPAYMIPDRIFVRDELPLNANGKIDRKAVMDLASGRTDIADQEEKPDGATEMAVAELWTRLLDLPTVARGRTFFASGGDSLLAMRLIEELRMRFGLELSLRELLRAPTVGQLATLIDQYCERERVGMDEGLI
jgi:aryl carrier-like protein